MMWKCGKITTNYCIDTMVIAEPVNEKILTDGLQKWINRGEVIENASDLISWHVNVLEKLYIHQTWCFQN